MFLKHRWGGPVSHISLTQFISERWRCCSSAHLHLTHHPLHPAARDALCPGSSPIMQWVRVSVLKSIRMASDGRHKLKSRVHSLISHRFAHSVPWRFPSTHFPRFMWDTWSRSSSPASPFLFPRFPVGSGAVPAPGMCAGFGWFGAPVLQTEVVELIDELFTVQEVVLRFPRVLFAPVAFPSD